MKIQEHYIFPQDESAFLTSYIRAVNDEIPSERRRALLICPGGGYTHVSTRENEPVALAFLARGYNVFVLSYSIGEMASGLRPLCEAALAMKHIRENAEVYNIDPEKVYILGFSAGGHLALSACVLADSPALLRLLPEAADASIIKPNGAVLCYPVVSCTCPTHLGSLYAFCGTEQPSGEMLELFCLEKHVSDTTPPMFIWHTEDDDCVSVENSLILAEALKERGISHELRLFPHGVHGLSLATHEVNPEISENSPHPAHVWVELADNWIKSQG